MPRFVIEPAMELLLWFVVLLVVPLGTGFAVYMLLQGDAASRERTRERAVAIIEAVEQMDRNPQGITDFQPGDLIGLAAFGKTREFLLVTHVVKVEYIQVVQTQSLEDYGEEAYPTRNACALLKQLGASLIRDGVEVISYKNYPYRERL